MEKAIFFHGHPDVMGIKEQSFISITGRVYSECIAEVQEMPLKGVPTNFILSFTLHKSKNIHQAPDAL